MELCTLVMFRPAACASSSSVGLLQIKGTCEHSPVQKTSPPVQQLGCRKAGLNCIIPVTVDNTFTTVPVQLKGMSMSSHLRLTQSAQHFKLGSQSQFGCH